jgi:integrase/recombinase XerD
MSQTFDWARVTALWEKSGRTPATIAVYLYWTRRFDAHCRALGHDPIAYLTLKHVRRVVAGYQSRRKGSSKSGNVPFTAVRALSCALAALGYSVPEWAPASPVPRQIVLVERYLRYRLRHRGIKKKTIRFNGQCAMEFIRFVRRRRRTMRTIRIVDIDAFVMSRSKMFTAKTVAGICSALRTFLRYLHMVGLIAVDLAVHVASPVVRSVDRPVRAVPWASVRRILRAIDTKTPLGLRDKALFLLMATYGMGTAEVIGLQLEDIDWQARRLRLQRPKTGVTTELPLIDPVGRALAAYLRTSRPLHASTRAVFVTDYLPHRPLSGSTTIRHRLALYASRAGVCAGYLGTHLFRHSHATRQIEQGQPAKVVGDILGHRRPESTSVYVRSALPRLRTLALPVPQ